MNYFFYFLASLFVLKVIWNFSIPIIALRMKRSGSKQGTISMMPVELIFLLAVTLYSYAKDEFDIFGLDTWKIALVGAALVVLSYLSISLFSKCWARGKAE
jgi:hypothetical protein